MFLYYWAANFLNLLLYDSKGWCWYVFCFPYPCFKHVVLFLYRTWCYFCFVLFLDVFNVKSSIRLIYLTKLFYWYFLQPLQAIFNNFIYSSIYFSFMSMAFFWHFFVYNVLGYFLKFFSFCLFLFPDTSLSKVNTHNILCPCIWVISKQEQRILLHSVYAVIWLLVWEFKGFTTLEISLNW